MKQTRKDIMAEALVVVDDDGYELYRCSVCETKMGCWPSERYKKFWHAPSRSVVCQDIDCRRAAERRAAIKG